MSAFQNTLNGQSVTSLRKFESENPATGESLGQVPHLSAEQVAPPISEPALTRTLCLCASRNLPTTAATCAVQKLVVEVTNDLCARDAWPGARQGTR